MTDWNLARDIGREMGLSRKSLCGHTRPVGSGYAVAVASARAGLRLAVRAARLRASAQCNRVLVPSYLCATVSTALAKEGVVLDFYRVNSRLEVDVGDVSARIAPDLLGVLIIRYFGFPLDQGLRDWLVKQRNLFILEDRAHVPPWDEAPPAPPISCAVYSPRKFASIPDFALVSFAEQPPAIRVEDTPDRQFVLRRLLGLLCLGVYEDHRYGLALTLGRQYLRRAEQDLDKRYSLARPSAWGMRAYASVDAGELCARRRRNYTSLLGKLRPTCLVQPLFGYLPDAMTPLGFPILSQERDRLRAYLIGNRIYPPVHWPLPAVVPHDEFPEADKVSRSILTIPIDQRYDERDMCYVANVLNGFS